MGNVMKALMHRKLSCAFLGKIAFLKNTEKILPKLNIFIKIAQYKV